LLPCDHFRLSPHRRSELLHHHPLPTRRSSDLVDPAIARAFTFQLSAGLRSEATDVMRFAAQPAGEYLIFCGVPGHGAAGMKIRLRVSATAKTPALLLTPPAASS